MASARRSAWCLVWLGLAAACGTTSSRPAPPAAGGAMAKLTRYPSGTPPRPLTVSTTDLATDGRTARVRGRTINDFDESVDGLRYLFVMIAPGSPPRILDHFTKETEDRIPPGGSTALSWDIQSMYFGSNGRFLLLAFPKRMGNREIPAPDMTGLFGEEEVR